MKHSEYVEFFRDIARTHPDILHSETEMHFGRLVITRDPLMGSQHQINEFLHNNGSKLKYPCMLLVAFRGDYADNRSDNKRKRLDGSFILLDKVREGDHDGEEAVYDRMESLGEEIATICIDHFEDHPEEGIFDINVMENEKIAKVANDKFGVKFYFGIDRSADALLSEALSQEKINSIADPGIYKNSDESFTQAIPSGTTYTAPDVVHKDSDGTEVPTPANVPFAAKLMTDPRFAGAELDDENAYIDIYFSEAEYSTALASGALEPLDFNLAFAQNGGDATAASISGLKKLDGATALEGGEIAVRATLSITGTPSGVETITISPVADSVFDADGNAMATTESVTAILNPSYSAETTAYKDRVLLGGGELISIDYVESVYDKLKELSILTNLKHWSSGRAGLTKDASDLVSKTFDLADINDTAQATGTAQPAYILGDKINYDGSSDYLDFGAASKTDLSFIQNTGIFTVSAKLKFTDLSNLKLRTVLGNTVTFSAKGFNIFYDNRDVNGNTKSVRVFLANGSGTAIAEISYANGILDTNEHRLTVTGDGTTMSLYIDDAVVATAALGTKSTGDSTYNMASGGVYNGTSMFDGYLQGEKDTWYITNNCLTQAQIAALNAL